MSNHNVSVYAVATNITSASGMDTAANWRSVMSGKSGIALHEDETYGNKPFYASKLSPAQWQALQAQTSFDVVLSPFEQLALFSAKQALQNCDEIDLNRTVVVLSSTKGNVEWLDKVPDERLLLSTSARTIAKILGIAKSVVISQACISGIAALIYAQRVLQAGKYKHAVVIGCDRFSRFVLNGFQSFHAIANAPCRPFDAARKGINLGEAASTIILSVDNDGSAKAKLLSGSVTNDANHISAPSRSGEALAMAIERTLTAAQISSADISMLSAHGTATVYNDEMEAKAFALAGLSGTPMHSVKGYFGHTLGAAGVLESTMVIESIVQQQLIPTLGYSDHGVPEPLNVITTLAPAIINYVLKSTSGFGGSNGVALWEGMR